MRWRAIAERLSRGIVLRRRLPIEHGGHCVFVTPEASLRFWSHDLRRVDPLLLDLCSELVGAGTTVWDVGANVGLFAFAAAHRVGGEGCVVAIEADPTLVRLLARSAAELPPTCGRVTVVAAAVARSSGEVDLAIARRGRAANHLVAVEGSTQAGGARTVVRVPAVSLDDLLRDRPAPSLVKVDVEGAELLCLQGAQQLLRMVRPVLLCEVAGGNSQAVADLLSAADYDVLDAAAPSHRRAPLKQAPWNTLALPRPLS